MNKDSILQRAENVTFEVVADEAILIDIRTGTYFSLNEVGHRVLGDARRRTND